MSLFQLDIRLNEIKRKIPQCYSLADIGSDHAYIPISALLEGVAQKAYITDINQGPLENSRYNAKKYKVDHKCEFLLGGGLEVLKDNVCDVIVISGMGAETISEILSQGAIQAEKAGLIIMQPMTQPEILRKFLCENSYFITEESIVKDAHLFYQIISARSAHMPCNNYISDLDYEFSPMLIANKDKTMYEFLIYKLKTFEKILKSLPVNNISDRRQIVNKIEFVRRKLSDYETE